ncbi:MAG: hypothetical protein HQM13_21875 [SAR324 cluster bacterium]|nr:hypothetical protein [SAR324 cluster bacterium]
MTEEEKTQADEVKSEQNAVEAEKTEAEAVKEEAETMESSDVSEETSEKDCKNFLNKAASSVPKKSKKIANSLLEHSLKYGKVVGYGLNATIGKFGDELFTSYEVVKKSKSAEDKEN